MTEFPHLFSPLDLAGRTLRNRLCLTATLTNFAQGNRVTERWRDFLVERARGGTAMLVSEIIAVDPEALAQGGVVTGFDDSNSGGFRETARGVAAAGGHLVGQLWHPGRQQLWHPTRSPQGVSDLPDALSWTVPHVMDRGEVRRIAEAYVAAAVRLAECGFAGVELHGAHGYLISQFLSPWSNTRDDDYGGSREKRCRFVLEVAAAIREACGAGFILGLKMPGDEGVPGGIDPEEAAALTAHLAAEGLFDYLAYGQGNFSLSLENHVPDLHFRPGHFLDIHRRMRAASKGVPVMALGKIGEPALAERIVAEGDGDLVGMTRALIADAAFAEKARTGRAPSIRRSVFDNFAWGEIHAGKPLAEFHNPELGRLGEAAYGPPPAAERRRVVVVGAGPAGLEAAWVAAARGHRVHLFGRTARVGGGLILEADLPGRADFGSVVAHQLHLCLKHGVTPWFDGIADAAAVRRLGPDVVLLATGAAERWPDGLAPESGPAVAARAYVAAGERAPADPQGRVVLFDMDQGPFVYALADMLAGRFRQVVLLTPRPQIAQGVNYCSAIGVHRRLRRAGTRILTGAEPVSLRDGGLAWRDVFTGARHRLGDVALLVYATPRRARDGLAAELADLRPVPIGDCRSPRNLLSAIHGGHAAAVAI